ncbi:MAG: amidohydrolase family protein [Gammaproteobacteria bacterium]|nr:amidohydrolase family protein [Gammaproteobacteria bacterium]
MASDSRRTEASRSFARINMHEHIHTTAEAVTLLDAMGMSGVEHVVLLGSPRLVFEGGPRRFDEHDLNNARILSVQNAAPDRFSAFVTLDPSDPRRLAKLRGYVDAGARGVKLYSGHLHLHGAALDTPDMHAVYAYVQDHTLPLMLHVNLRHYAAELESLLSAFPRLELIIPHLGVWAGRLSDLDELLVRHPNVYLDFSFGSRPDYVLAGLRLLSGRHQSFREFFSRHRHRIVYGTDVVVRKQHKAAAIADLFWCYQRALERHKYRCALAADEELLGLALDEPTLRAIYEVNPRRLLALDPTR